MRCFRFETDLGGGNIGKTTGWGEVSGIRWRLEKRGEDVVITKVCIDTQSGKDIGKAMGDLCQYRSDCDDEEDSGYYREISEIFFRAVEDLLPKRL